jgi:hypothetical protein
MEFNHGHDPLPALQKANENRDGGERTDLKCLKCDPFQTDAVNGQIALSRR